MANNKNYIYGATKKGMEFINKYEEGKNAYDGLYTVYARPSWQKLRSFEKIEEQMEKDNGYGLKITGWNSNTYSAAYIRPILQQWQIVYYTAWNTYYIDVNDEIMDQYNLMKALHEI